MITIEIIIVIVLGLFLGFCLLVITLAQASGIKKDTISIHHNSISDEIKKYDYAEWFISEDKKVCEECKKMEGTRWITTLKDAPSAPHHKCQNKTCRCGIVYSSGPNEREIVLFLRKNGGIVTGEMMQSYFDKKEAIQKEEERINQIYHDKVTQAQQIEKIEPEKAVLLYREAIKYYTEKAFKINDPFCWRNMGYYYNRITMLLFNLKQYDEALSEIKAFEQLPGEVNKGDKNTLEAINKRKIRILKKKGIEK